MENYESSSFIDSYGNEIKLFIVNRGSLLGLRTTNADGTLFTPVTLFNLESLEAFIKRLTIEAEILRNAAKKATLEEASY